MRHRRRNGHEGGCASTVKGAAYGPRYELPAAAATEPMPELPTTGVAPDLMAAGKDASR